MKNQIILLLLLIVSSFMLDGCAVRSPHAPPILAHAPASVPSALSAPAVDAFPHNKMPPRKTKMKSILAHLRLGLTEKTVHRRVGRADEVFITPLFNSGWYYRSDAYHCADGTLWIEYADSPPTQEESAGRVTCIAGPTFDIGVCRP